MRDAQRRHNLYWLWLALAFLAADQISKFVVIQTLTPGQPVIVLPIFNLTLAFNTGAAFSFLGAAGGWQHWLFGGIALTISAVLILWIHRLKPGQRLQAISMTMILGGAIGNLIDRVHLGYVIDFIQFHWQQYYFAIFNLADTWICVGAALFFIASLKEKS